MQIAPILLVAIMTTFARFCRMAHGFSPQRLSRKSNMSPLPVVLSDPMSTSVRASNEKKLDPLVICGPSGVGKGTIIEKFMKEMGGKDLFDFSVSHTTRAPRPGEENGVHYHFVEMDFMKNEIAQGAFLEHAEVHGNFYGTSWSSVRDVQSAGKRCLLDIDVQGVKNIKSMESEILQPKYIFIAPPSFEELEQRLIDRGTESAESLARRTANARREVKYGNHTKNFDAIVVNRQLDLACQEFAELVRKLYEP